MTAAKLARFVAHFRDDAELPLLAELIHEFHPRVRRSLRVDHAIPRKENSLGAERPSLAHRRGVQTHEDERVLGCEQVLVTYEHIRGQSPTLDVPQKQFQGKWRDCLRHQNLQRGPCHELRAAEAPRRVTDL